MRGTSSRTIGVVVAIIAVGTSWAVMQRASAQQRSSRVLRRGAASIDAALQEPDVKESHRLREGAALSNQLGTFKSTGDRISFQLDGQQDAMQVLENLALERVGKMMDDTRGRQWSVSGKVTEYRGHNFLLIDRATLRARMHSVPAKP